MSAFSVNNYKHELTGTSSAANPAKRQRSLQRLTSEQKLEKNLDAARIQQAQQGSMDFLVSARKSIPKIFTKKWNNSLVRGPKTHMISSMSEVLGSSPLGIASCQGIRPTMEDTHLARKLSFQNQGITIDAQLFAVCDGHGADKIFPDTTMASQFVVGTLTNAVIEEFEKVNDQELTDDVVRTVIKNTVTSVTSAFESYYLNMFGRLHFQNNYGRIFHQDGTTLIAALVIGQKLWTINVGDSRACVIFPSETIQTSEDANLDIERYRKQIFKRGGSIVDVRGTLRVNSWLGMAKAIGDGHIINEYGKPVLDSRPKITVIDIKESCVLVLACDGLFDVVSTEELGEAVCSLKAKGRSVCHITENLVYSALLHESFDNITVLAAEILVPGKEPVWGEPVDIFLDSEEENALLGLDES